MQRNRKVAAYLTLIIGAIFTLKACSHLPVKENFSQYPGFKTYFKDNPPQQQAASPSEKALLQRFKPRFYIAPESDAPIDFYRDYIGSGVLYDGASKIISETVSAQTLNEHKYDPTIVFRHHPRETSHQPRVFGRVDYDTLSILVNQDEIRHKLTYLTYHLVFAHSGLPAALPKWQSLLLGTFVSITDWHQLDHYTAVTIALDEQQQPIAVTLQQHNGLRTYLLGESLHWPDDDHVKIDVAQRSNELYPHSPQKTRHRAVSFPNRKGLRYLLSGENPPFIAADDITHGVLEVDYLLDYLPHNDAFYVFYGYLGERRLLPGRDGPPGAEYNTLPQFKDKSMQMISGYWRPDHSGDLQRFDTSMERENPFLSFFHHQKAVFYYNWKTLHARSPRDSLHTARLR